jgi:hypothetical protein
MCTEKIPSYKVVCDPKENRESALDIWWQEVFLMVVGVKRTLKGGAFELDY